VLELAAHFALAMNSAGEHLHLDAPGATRAELGPDRLTAMNAKPIRIRTIAVTVNKRQIAANRRKPIRRYIEVVTTDYTGNACTNAFCETLLHC